MRAIFIKQTTNWQALAPTLLAGSADPAQVLVKLQRLNPHLDFARIADGAVILLPEGAAVRAGASKSVAGESFTALAAQLGAAVDSAVQDARSGHDELLAQHKQTLAVLKSKPVLEMVGDDQDLLAALKAALAAADADAARAKEASGTLAALQQLAEQELATLASALGARERPTRAGPEAPPTPPAPAARRRAG
jgi:hypothetical protein